MVTDSRAALRADRLRPLNQPYAIEVEVDERAQPLAITAEKRRVVEEIIEMWRVDDEWWRDPVSRRYANVVLEGGAHVVLYEDMLTNEWFMQTP